jgi:TolA-binding protein
MSQHDAERASLAQHLEPELPQARLDRSWAKVRARVDRDRDVKPRGVRASVWIGGAVALAAAALLTFGAPLSESPIGTPRWTLAPGARVEAPSAGVEALLADGSRLMLDQGTSLRGVVAQAHEVAIEVETGRATFDVARDPSREFRVEAGDVRVVVVGTRFSVQRVDGRVSVEVERGRVEVHRGTDLVVLGPTDRWEGAEEIPVAEPALVEEETAEATPRRASTPRETSASHAEEESVDVARTLFEAARAARREGRSDRAAALFAELVDQHPTDARAPIAAFELGRLRLDVLHDAPGAASALERSLALSPQASFRQDALARLVSAYDRAGRAAECTRARDRYLREYPDGVHALEVGSLCE